jgi:hypothetical protein
MRTPTLLKLLAVFAILIIIILAQRFLLPRLNKSQSPYLQTVSQLTPDSVTQITLEKGDDHLNLAQDSGTWKVDQIPAKTWQIDTLVRTLLQPDSPQLIAQTTAKHQDLEVDADQATKITLKSPDRDLIPLLVGTSSSQTYVRFDGESPVYSLGTPPEISTDPQDWYDLTVTQLTAVDITKIVIHHSRESFAFERSDDQWTLKDSRQALDQDKVNSLTSNLASFTATQLDTTQTPDQLTSPTTTLEIHLKDQDQATILNFTPQEPQSTTSQYYVTKSSDSRVFIVSNYTAQPFLAPLKDYLQS